MKSNSGNYETIVPLMVAAVVLISAILIAINPLSTTPPKKENETKIYSGETAIFVRRFQYEGHDYIMFSGVHPGRAVVHDPECKSCKGIRNIEQASKK